MNKINISGKHYQTLKAHLFPGDGKEAVAIALCGRSAHNENKTLLVQELLLVPHEVCDRGGDYVRWPTDVITPFLEKASGKNKGIIKFHCHPGKPFYEKFSAIDNESDSNLFPGIQAWLDDDEPHASCIMLPDGRIFGRFFEANHEISPVDQINVVGADLLQWRYGALKKLDDRMQARNEQTFGKGTITTLNQMKIGVLGTSGTGSIVIEQLKRLGVGTLVIADPDHVDFLNLNRILGTEKADAEEKRLKVDVMAREVEKVGMGTKVIAFGKHILSNDIIKEFADCDFLFSSVDGAEGRHILNQISSYYLIGMIDMGVKLSADGKGGIDGINGVVHFIQPGGSSLLSRGQYTIEQLRAEGIYRVDKEEYARNQYLASVNESSPAVITINMQTASTAVNEFLARVHPYRNIENADVDSINILFSDGVSFPESHPEPCPLFLKMLGKGDVEPLLNNVELSLTDVKASY